MRRGSRPPLPPYRGDAWVHEWPSISLPLKRPTESPASDNQSVDETEGMRWGPFDRDQVAANNWQVTLGS